MQKLIIVLVWILNITLTIHLKDYGENNHRHKRYLTPVYVPSPKVRAQLEASANSIECSVAALNSIKCYNGGICYGSSCLCPSSYKGRNWELKIDKQKKFKIITFVLFGLGSILLGMIISLCLRKTYRLWCKREPKYRDDYSR